ncbi:hypothetical protein GUJ93_ZPchr0002g25687 [Zizania palustris]|uniref:Uncharacterized protein n=1 Tax=Zizania palustris TaxID=103762 RepID=A0A8J5S9Q5_ZIZPA|nr:hypothetical protein GUJ93_ZPchr0002g25687 [Zizania palustris]
MGLCVSMLHRVTRRPQPEPTTRGTAPTKPLFVVRSDRRRPPPWKQAEAPVVFQSQNFGQLHFQNQKPRSWADATRGHDERFRCQVAPPKRVRLPCQGRTNTPAVDEPVAAAADQRSLMTPTMTTACRGAPPERRRTPTVVGRSAPPEGSRTPAAAPPMTPMRPVWQRRILMGMRCELPRFSGLILYDEHGRAIRGSTPGRSHTYWRKRTTKTSTTLMDLL